MRTFATCFNLQDHIYEFERSGSIKCIEHLYSHLDNLILHTDAKRPEDKIYFMLDKRMRCVVLYKNVYLQYY